MMKLSAGDIVLVEVVFSEGAGAKKRPALILSSKEYHGSRQEVIIAAITSNIDRVLTGDTKIRNWRDAGLLFPSLVTGIIQTIKSNMIIKKLGSLSKADFENIKDSLRRVLCFE